MVASVLKVLACVAGRRKRGRKVKMTAAARRYGWRPLPRSSRASRARLSPFPPLRTHATRATQVSSSRICKEGLFPTSTFRQMTFSISFLKLLQRPTQGQKRSRDPKVLRIKLDLFLCTSFSTSLHSNTSPAHPVVCFAGVI